MCPNRKKQSIFGKKSLFYDSIPIGIFDNLRHKTVFRMKTPILNTCCDMQKIGIYKSKVKNTKKILFYTLIVLLKNNILLSNRQNNHYMLCFRTVE